MTKEEYLKLRKALTRKLKRSKVRQDALPSYEFRTEQGHQSYGYEIGVQAGLESAIDLLDTEFNIPYNDNIHITE